MTPDAWDAVLNVHAEDDHIIPPLTSPALDGKVDTKDQTGLGRQVVVSASSPTAIRRAAAARASSTGSPGETAEAEERACRYATRWSVRPRRSPSSGQATWSPPRASSG